MHAARAALIFATFPLLTSLIAAALGRERLTLSKLIGVLLTILGVGLALGEQTLQRGAVHDAWVGELAVFASAVSGAVCSVLYRPYLEKYPTLSVGAFGMVASVVFLVPLAAGEGFFASRPKITPGGWTAVAFIGLGSGGGYYLWLWALGQATPTRGHRLPGAQSRHRGRARRLAPRRARLAAGCARARLGRGRPRPGAPRLVEPGCRLTASETAPYNNHRHDKRSMKTASSTRPLRGPS